MSERKKVVIIGGGFGGLQAAKTLTNEDVDVLLIDRRNHHVFQPLLYQVATAVLSPGEIASPIRRILNKSKNVEVLLGEVADLELARDRKAVRLEDGTLVEFDYLIIAAGARHSYFGNDQWESFAPGLKTLDDAVDIRRRVLFAFELAERQASLNGVYDDLNFVIVGGGPTGVELAGAIADIARKALAKDFRQIDTKKTNVILLEGSDRVLGTFGDDLSQKAKLQLESLGVQVRLNSFVTEIEPGKVKVADQWLHCDVVIWATGVAASPLGQKLGSEIDRAGRVLVNPDLTITDHKNVFVIGDMASMKQADGSPVPGVSPAAMQMGTLASKNILADLNGKQRKDFVYVDKGSMATIGRRRAIADLNGWKFSGFIAWLMWLFLHVMFLIGFRNKLFVLIGWFWAYLTRERSARLITGSPGDLRPAIEFIGGTEAVQVIDTMMEKELMRRRLKVK